MCNRVVTLNRHTGVLEDVATHSGGSEALTTPDVVSETMTGDWVLFHPVYTAEELRAVQVCLNRQ